MIGEINISFVIGFTLTMIIKQLGFFTIPIIVCTDSYSLYECLVKLGITKKTPYNRYYGNSWSVLE